MLAALAHAVLDIRNEMIYTADMGGFNCDHGFPSLKFGSNWMGLSHHDFYADAQQHKKYASSHMGDDNDYSNNNN